MGGDEIENRIRRAKETQAAAALVLENPSWENVAALHRLHARHLLEEGDPAGAARAEARAERAEGNLQDLAWRRAVVKELRSQPPELC